ncbi:hypothetical protein [Pseudophaeobacter sp.]|uniref:RcgA family putative transporter n=1 Tax=Pseudophaeobacter sp. TaxID=1971739 RepID=UPI0032997D1A
MIKNGKFFVAPQKSSDTFKVLFARLAAEGAGRPVDRRGFADGPWTPETLADAISSIEENPNGIELRAVQIWFQENDNGISNDNIRWLARILGCNDPEETSRWQAELKASKDRLTSVRREKRMLAAQAQDLDQKSEDSEIAAATKQYVSPIATSGTTQIGISHRAARTLAEKVEWLLSGSISMNLQIVYWLVFCGLGLMNYVLNTLSVTYSPIAGLDKQVGFIWAPTLSVLPLIVLPLFISSVSDLNTYWKQVGRSRCTSVNATSIDLQSHAAWYAKVNDFSFSFWAIALFCFFFVFGFQWFGIYVPAYLSGDTNGVQIDRYLVALVRPEVISIPEAVVLSLIGYLYTASYISIFMFGLLFLVIIVLDYHDICTTSDLEGSTVDSNEIRKEGQKIVWGGFRVVVSALWLALLIKLQITYLSSDSPDVVRWLATDTMAAFGVTDIRNGWLKNSSISHFTTFLMMAVTVTVSIACALKVQTVFERLSVYDCDYPFARDQWAIFKMSLVIASLSLTLMLVGRFTGFSLILAASILASLHVLSGPRLRTFEVDDGAS